MKNIIILIAVHSIIISQLFSAPQHLWHTTTNFNSRQDILNSVSEAPDGSIYASGYYDTGNNTLDQLIVKYNQSGERIWDRTLNTVGINQNDILNGQTIDSKGNITVAGYQTYTTSRYVRQYIRQYSGDGTTNWTRTYNYLSTPNDVIYDVCSDSDDSVFTLGTYRYDVNNGYRRVNIMKFSSSNTQLGSTILGIPYGSPSASDIHAASDGNIYIAGSYYNPNNYNIPGQRCAWLFKYNNSLTQRIWEKNNLYEPTYLQAMFYSITEDNEGNIYACGIATLHSNRQNGMLIHKYSPDGELLFKADNFNIGTIGNISKINYLQQGELIISGNVIENGLGKIGLWFFTEDGEFIRKESIFLSGSVRVNVMDHCIDNNGIILLAGYNGLNGNDTLLAKYSYLEIENNNLTSKHTGEYFETLLKSKYNSSPVAWSLTDGTLPEGINIAPDGTLSGTTYSPGEYTFTIRIDGANDTFNEKTFTIRVYPQSDGTDISPSEPKVVGGKNGYINPDAGEMLQLIFKGTKGDDTHIQICNLDYQPLREFEFINVADKNLFLWDGLDSNGEVVPPGVYLLMLKTGFTEKIIKIAVGR